ncbi:MAG: DUF4433 domain-containing protein [Ramlibacter sp.]|nr:DUF4433 domain-containing protein [Ramlibacter sp.]
MSLESVIAERGIESVLHFTTNKGSLGVLASKIVRPRARLTTDERLEHIFTPNAANRPRDAAWLDYVNLSMSRINHQFFAISSGNWHRDEGLWWAILDFRAEILTHPGVFFTTTNNMYSGVCRAEGEAGLVATFAPKIAHWVNKVVERAEGIPENFTTCFQAEALYPGDLSTDFLQRIFVRDEESADELASQFAVTSHPTVEIAVRPDLFIEIH